MVVIASSCFHNYMEGMSERTPSNHPILQLESYWPYWITVLADRISRRTSQIVKSHGLNLSQWRVLAAIAESPGRSSAEVVQVTPMDKGIVSRATKALLDRGLLHRRASQTDGRLSHLFLMPDGQRLYQDIRPQVQDIVLAAQSELKPGEQDHLNRLLRTLVQVLPDLR